MSFSFDILASSKSEVMDAILTAYAPDSIKMFLLSAVQPYPEPGPDKQIYVKAHGHLYDGHSYDVSSATIEVKMVEAERVEPAADPARYVAHGEQI